MSTGFVALCLVLFLLATGLEITAVSRRFAKFWNKSLVFPNGANVNAQSLVLTRRSECVSWCAYTPNCCCTQWVFANKTCTILAADRAGLSNATGVVSSIDSTLHCNLSYLYTFAIILAIYLVLVLIFNNGFTQTVPLNLEHLIFFAEFTMNSLLSLKN